MRCANPRLYRQCYGASCSRNRIRMDPETLTATEKIFQLSKTRQAWALGQPVFSPGKLFCRKSVTGERSPAGPDSITVRQAPAARRGTRKEKRRTGLTRSQTFLHLQAYEIQEGESQGQGEIYCGVVPKWKKSEYPRRIARLLNNRKAKDSSAGSRLARNDDRARMARLKPCPFKTDRSGNTLTATATPFPARLVSDPATSSRR
jgi:hypothetical protein